jgi:hypothetical protein
MHVMLSSISWAGRIQRQTDLIAPEKFGARDVFQNKLSKRQLEATIDNTLAKFNTIVFL